jgi:type II secretory pathway pseudopilin PulG
MVELLVVVTIFAIASIAISATYVNFTRLHRRAANAELLGEEMRFALELIVRAARNNRVHYWVNPYPVRSSRLALQDLDGNRVYIQNISQSNSICSGLNGNCLALYLEGKGWTPITGKNVHVKRFDVFVTPLDDPFMSVGVGMYANDQQPRVTIVMDAEYRASNARETASMSVQTSVSSRVYVR